MRPAKASSIYDLQPDGKGAMLMVLLDWDQRWHNSSGARK
jgi:hypothetical protein